jgi:hypothetical protein
MFPLLKNFRREVLLKQGIELLEEDACPLCDLPWNTTELLAHLQQKLALVGEATKALDAIQKATTPLKAPLTAFEQDGRKLIAIAARLDPKIDAALLSDAFAKCLEWRQLIEDVCNKPERSGKRAGGVRIHHKASTSGGSKGDICHRRKCCGASGSVQRTGRDGISDPSARTIASISRSTIGKRYCERSTRSRTKGLRPV